MSGRSPLTLPVINGLNWGQRIEDNKGGVVMASKTFHDPSFDLFQEAIEKGLDDRVLLIGMNLVTKYPKDPEYFSLLFESIYNKAYNSKDLQEVQGLFGLANDICSSFSLAMDITDENMSLVEDCRKRIRTLQICIDRLQVKYSREERIKGYADCKKILDAIEEQANNLMNCSTAAELQQITKEIIQKDKELDHNKMSAPQQKRYDDLTSNISEHTASLKMRFDRDAIKEINIDAVKLFKSVLEQFKTGEAKYKKDILAFSVQLSQLVHATENDLLPETMLYHSDVYNHIFSTINDDQKYLLTKFTIEQRGILE